MLVASVLFAGVLVATLLVTSVYRYDGSTLLISDSKHSAFPIPQQLDVMGSNPHLNDISTFFVGVFELQNTRQRRIRS